MESTTRTASDDANVNRLERMLEILSSNMINLQVAVGKLADNQSTDNVTASIPFANKNCILN